MSHSDTYLNKRVQRLWIAHLINRSKGHSEIPFQPRSTNSKQGITYYEQYLYTDTEEIFVQNYFIMSEPEVSPGELKKTAI